MTRYPARDGPTRTEPDELSDVPAPAPPPPRWRRAGGWVLTGAATGLDVTAELLRLDGHDGLAFAARTTATGLRLIDRVFARTR